MRVKFYLARPTAEETSIVANVHLGRSGMMRVGTGVTVETKHWDKKKHRCRTRGYRQGGIINTRLYELKGRIEACYYEHLHQKGTVPTQAEFRKLINSALGRGEAAKLAFFEYFKDFIDRTKNGQRQTSSGKLIGPEKAKSYGSTYNKLKDFKPRLDFGDIDLDFYHDLVGWLRKSGYSENYIGTHIKNLKAVLNEATERGVNSNTAFRSKRFSKPQEEADNIALTVKELQDLEKLKLMGCLDRVRDLFLIGCHTGLRYGDLSRLTIEDIKGGYIEVTQQKTGKPVAIPVHPVVKSIIEKYDNDLPPAISNQKTNEYLKEVCKKVPALCEYTTKTSTKGGLKVSKRYRKWEMVGTHTARRTFATNAYLQSIPTITIMAITGHKTERNFLKYIKVTPKEHAKIMAGFWAKDNMKIVK